MKNSRVLAASRTATAGVIIALAVMITGCSSSDPGAAASAAGGSAAPQAGSDVGGRRAGSRMPGVSGLIADVEGRTLQVQSASEQTAVSYTGKTAIEEISSATADDVATGWCATVTSNVQSSASPGMVPSKINARSVSLTKATGGSCEAGFRGGSGGAPSGGPPGRFGDGTGRFPTARPSGRPSNAPGGRAGAMGTFATGKITKITGSGFVLDAVRRDAESSRTVTVTVDKNTDYTKQQAATSSAIRSGECVTAIGKSDDTGAVAATRMTLSAAKKGSCTPVFGGFSGGRGGSRSNG